MSDRRAWGYRLLGRGFDYLLHLRPAEWPIMLVHLLTGSALSLGLYRLVSGHGGMPLLAGALAFVVGLNGGTLALNSALLVIESGEAASKIGVQNQWLQVRDIEGKEGYVAAWYVTRG